MELFKLSNMDNLQLLIKHTLKTGVTMTKIHKPKRLPSACSHQIKHSAATLGSHLLVGKLLILIQLKSKRLSFRLWIKGPKACKKFFGILKAPFQSAIL